MYKYKISKSPCAPSSDSSGKFKTCYSLNSLKKIAEELKKKHNLKVDLEKIKKNYGINPKTI